MVSNLSFISPSLCLSLFFYQQFHSSSLSLSLSFSCSFSSLVFYSAGAFTASHNTKTMCSCLCKFTQEGNMYFVIKMFVFLSYTHTHTDTSGPARLLLALIMDALLTLKQKNTCSVKMWDDIELRSPSYSHTHTLVSFIDISVLVTVFSNVSWWD